MAPGLVVRFASTIAISAIVLLLSAVNAWALEVRFVHAVPGAGPAKLNAGRTDVGGAVGFAGVTRYARVRAGRTDLRLTSPGGGESIARATESLSGERVTVVATRSGKRVTLQTFSDSRAEGRRARFRAINAAPELGAADVQLDGRVTARSLEPGRASPYQSSQPGRYKVDVTRPGGRGGSLATRSGVGLVAGTSTTAFVVGSGGEPTRIVIASDGAAAPRAAPATGLGGLSGGTPWVAVLAAALAAGAAGGAAYTLASRRRRHGA
jgi:hypothetical protein